jgi:3-deoxy-D-manno-oct-2-ulosonic acid (Kdo) hydroxylase
MDVIQEFSTHCRDNGFPSDLKKEAIEGIEHGKVLFFPRLAFTLLDEEKFLLSPHWANPKHKNISYIPQSKTVQGTLNLSESQQDRLKAMMERFYRYAYDLIITLFPSYAPQLIIGRSSYRPLRIGTRETSYRQDDRRLHVDAFPASPNQGKRILRVFSNVNPLHEPRIWRIGEPFATVVKQFLPKLSKPLPGKSFILHSLKMTKSRRSFYDHFMLQLHNAMKKDERYQEQAKQVEIPFPATSTWVVQTDQVSHAVKDGEYALEQTFYLPVEAMQDPLRSPLRILEQKMGYPLA